MSLSVGEWIQVRSKEEILATLDERGRLDELPFMPQMLTWCGQRFRVLKRAHKTCDTVTGASTGAWLARRLPGTIHLDLRCDGEAYGGCQAACLLFWKEAWLKPIDEHGVPLADERILTKKDESRGCTERDIWNATKFDTQDPRKGTKYKCQATELPQYTRPLSKWDARQYAEDLASGNVTLAAMFRSFLYFVFARGTMARRPRIGRPARWIYDLIQSFWGGVPFPRRGGDLDSDKDAPVVDIGLQPGDIVRVRPYREILATIDKQSKNRGMGFDAEMVPYCGKTFRVRTRVEHFIDETTGYMRRMKTPAVILDGVYCQSRYSENRVFCPRRIFAWWREVWLERISREAAQNHREMSG
jgi:hypothetical protein